MPLPSFSCTQGARGITGRAQALAGALALLEARVQAYPDELLISTDAALLACLSERGGPATRRVIAANRCAPMSVDVGFAEDEDEGVRAALASKISWRLSAYDENSPAHKETLAIVRRLASDPSTAVRATLAQEIRHLCTVPIVVIQMLAWDMEVSVSEPILEFSPLLSENDLLEIILADGANSIVAAIARRRPLGADLCDAIAFFLHSDSINELLSNPEASIRAQALDHVARHIERVPACLDLLARRQDLSRRAKRQISKVKSLVANAAPKDDLDCEGASISQARPWAQSARPSWERKSSSVRRIRLLPPTPTTGTQLGLNALPAFERAKHR